ncbi:hypothetical protein HJB80_02805 [Rhizobium lentis]|uniref:helix-turn-helix domain-containing protein n=1 Tax=Rhizobium lentis TaxID=1138194 RepID=UPI001C82A066|nr:helix-turn-helix domain-containing protein [Rhizobium lentis]MBX5131622.1 hypothetical protein [Rhizobium lentis]
MNMQVSALREQHERYKAARERLWFTKPKAETAEPAPIIVRIISARKPAWKVQEISFDLHVQQYNERLQSLKLTPIMVYVRDRCNDFGVYYEDLTVHCRRREFVRPRQIIMWELRNKFQLSYPRIGRIFGGLDHTTCISAVRRVDAMMAAGQL